MSIAAQKYSLAETLERIQSVFTELRQTEALEAQIHEMVVMKRHRLDALMTDYLERAVNLTDGAPSLSPSASLPAASSTPVPKSPPTAPIPPPAPAAKSSAPPQSLPGDDMHLSPHGLYGAPRDLLKSQPAPSAQHVLDSLNRLMTNMKDNSSRSVNAA
jgi:hypothetical protein